MSDQDIVTHEQLIAALDAGLKPLVDNVRTNVMSLATDIAEKILALQERMEKLEKFQRKLEEELTFVRKLIK